MKNIERADSGISEMGHEIPQATPKTTSETP